jgi:hypothetical protein
MSFLDYSTDEGPFGEPIGAALADVATPVPRTRHRIHPLTWVVAAALMPVLCWDAWQSLQEAKQRVHTHAGAQIESGVRAIPRD